MNNFEADLESEKLIAELRTLDGQVNALELTKRIEFFRLYRILDATVQAISIAEDELEEVVEKHKVALNFANKLYFCFFATACVLSIVNYFFYSMSWFTALPTWLIVCALLYQPLSEPMRLQKLVFVAASALDRYRFEAQCTGFTIQFLSELTLLLKSSMDEYYGYYKIELRQKSECFRLCNA